MRQWVLSVPIPLRFLFASQPAVISKVLGIVYRTIATFGFFWFDPAQFNWVPGFDLAHQGRLFSVGTTEVLNVDGVPAGSYAFVFGVDLNPSGGLDFDQLHEYRVVVQVN